MSYLLTQLAKDPSVKKALKKALSDDGRLSFKEIQSIIYTVFNTNGISQQEFKDLQMILKKSKTIDLHSKRLIQDFIKSNHVPAPSKTTSKNITPNFSLSEFACHDGTSVPNRFIPNVKKLAQNLEVLRESLNSPIKIVSGYRSPVYNASRRKKSTGVAKNSQHLYAKAADIRISGVTPKEIETEILKLISEKKMEQGGLHRYDTKGNNFVHYDVRGKKARW